ncbi:MAG: hypothetical protein ABI305_09640 [Tepidiformaceae bacterium]
MFVPGVRQGFHVPRHLPPFIFGTLAIIGTLLAWAAISPGHLSNEAQYQALIPSTAASIHSVAYVLPGAFGGQPDRVYTRRADAPTTGGERYIASFDVPFSNLHVLGSSSPTGARLAVLHASDGSTYAQLSLVPVLAGNQIDLDGDFDYLARIAWSADGERLALTRTTHPDDAGRSHVDVTQINAATGQASTLAQFDGVFDAAPVGYSLDGQRAFIVVVDQSGSNLWTIQNGKALKTAALSPGRTRDWSLSPDGSRLAYVDVLGAAARAYAGRTLLIATGEITDTNAPGSQLGPVWPPGSQIPQFGGPGGSVQLSPAPPDGTYLVPVSWSPDGKTLVATIYSASSDPAESPTESVELFSFQPDSQEHVQLAGDENARFLGWVVD